MAWTTGGHCDLRIVIADPSGHAAEELEPSSMTFQECCGTFPGKCLNKDRIRIWQRHDKQRDLREFPGEPDIGKAEVDLRVARRM